MFLKIKIKSSWKIFFKEQIEVVAIRKVFKLCLKLFNSLLILKVIYIDGKKCQNTEKYVEENTNHSYSEVIILKNLCYIFSHFKRRLFS